MLPVTPAGHRGSPAGPGGMSAAAIPSPASAVLAHQRAAANSARRRGPAVRIASSSAGGSGGPGGGTSPKDSAATAAAGRTEPISPRRCGPGTGPARCTAGYCGRSAIQTARASAPPGLRQVCGWSPRKCSVLPGPTW